MPPLVMPLWQGFVAPTAKADLVQLAQNNEPAQNIRQGSINFEGPYGRLKFIKTSTMALQPGDAEACEEAISLVAANFPGLPNRFVIYVMAGASRGVSYEPPLGNDEYRIWLGTSGVNYRAKNVQATNMIKAQNGVDIKGGVGPGTGLRTVGDQLYDSEKKTARKRQALLMASILHELGHATHQRLHLQHYETMTHDYQTQNNAWTLPYQQQLQVLANKVSFYAQQKPPEFVAEVFSGLMMGMTYSAKVYQAYVACGGPVMATKIKWGKVGFDL